jgi:hypothetical protein
MHVSDLRNTGLRMIADYAVCDRCGPLAPDVVAAINDALDSARQHHEFPNDKALAQFLGVSAKTLSWWRHGKVSPTNRGLLYVLFLHKKEGGK